MKKIYTITEKIKMPKPTLKKEGESKKQAAAAVQRGVLKASTQVERELGDALDRSMASAVWGPFSPKEQYMSRGGNLRGKGYRSLIDTGELKNSKSITTSFLKTQVNIRIKYSAPYAVITHYGGVIQPWGNPRASAVLLPARPWVRDTLQEGGPVPFYDVLKVYEDNIAESWM